MYYLGLRDIGSINYEVVFCRMWVSYRRRRLVQPRSSLSWRRAGIRVLISITQSLMMRLLVDKLKIYTLRCVYRPSSARPVLHISDNLVFACHI